MAYLFGTKRSGVRIRAKRVSASEAPHITSRGPTEMQKHLLFSLGVAQFVSKQKSKAFALLFCIFVGSHAAVGGKAAVDRKHHARDRRCRLIVAKK